MDTFAVRRLRGRRVRRLAYKFDSHQLGRDRLTQIGQHGLEQLEGLGLVFVERVALRITAESDHRAEMIKIDEVLAPQMVECLQQNRLFDIGHDIGAETLGAL